MGGGGGGATKGLLNQFHNCVSLICKIRDNKSLPFMYTISDGWPYYVGSTESSLHATKIARPNYHMF